MPLYKRHSSWSLPSSGVTFIQRLQHVASYIANLLGACVPTYTDTVKFGEVVQAPPRLSAKPRGSEKMSRKTPKYGLMKASSLLDPTTDRSQLSTGGLKRQKDIEEEREAVIKKYREMKKVKLKHF